MPLSSSVAGAMPSHAAPQRMLTRRHGLQEHYAKPDRGARRLIEVNSRSSREGKIGVMSRTEWICLCTPSAEEHRHGKTNRDHSGPP